MIMTPSDICFAPSDQEIRSSQLTGFMTFVAARTARTFPTYSAFEDFSITEFRKFWTLMLEWLGLPVEGRADPVCTSDVCEDAAFFPDLRLNYAECVLAGIGDQATAVTNCHFGHPPTRVTGAELRRNVERLAMRLRSMGVGPGDCVLAITRNNAEVVVVALAAAAVGAVFASCASDMPTFAILSRVRQLDPKVLFANVDTADGDMGVPLHVKIEEIVEALSSVTAVVALDAGAFQIPRALPGLRYRDIVEASSGERFTWHRFPFNHPLFILFSSGTTGPPKGIVHGAGGTLLEHCKEHRLHCNLLPGDRMLFHTSTSWMMWNWQLSALASGVELVTYDGPLRTPDMLWRLVAEHEVTTFGTSAAFLQISESQGYSPGRDLDLNRLRSVLSTGSILYDYQFDWVTQNVKPLALQSISGGTDIIGCFVLGNPNLPVRRGYIQCRSLGMDVRALRTDQSKAGEGELVCANPFPSRPLGFWQDDSRARFHKAYFEQNPGYWTHGDLLEFTASGGIRMHGRSDGVLNIAGLRIGPSEINSILLDVEGIEDSLAVELEDREAPGGRRLVLLIVLHRATTYGPEVNKAIRSALFAKGSTAMLPYRILPISEMPRTHNGKISLAAARDAVNARVPRNIAVLANPATIDEIAAAMRA